MYALQYTSVWPYFILMTLFFLEAKLILTVTPFYRRAMTQELADKSHLSLLDGLRGLLALSIFFTHAETSRAWWTSGQWTLPDSRFYSQLAIAPVGIFFMITGFLFWMKAQNAKPESLLTFFSHRIRRLFPAYLFAVTLLWFITAGLTHFHRNVPVGSLLKSALGYLDFGLFSGPFLNGLTFAPLIVANAFWSLRVEWMFYIAFPVLALFARTRLRQLVLLLISIGLYMLLPLVRGHVAPKGFGTLGLGTLMYFNFFLITYFSFGMLAAYIKKNIALPAVVRSAPTSIVGILAIAITLLVVPPKAGLVEGAVLAVPFFFVVFGNSFFGLLRQRPLILLGQISYSTYILHGIVVFVEGWLLTKTHSYASFTPAKFWFWTAVSGMIVVGLSAGSYRFFEAPFMKGYGTKASSLPIP